jgi:hypothetical protein
VDTSIIDSQELGFDPSSGAPLQDGQPQIDDTPDFKALFEQSEADKQRIAGELAQTRQAQNQMGMQQVDAMWQQAEGVAWQNAEQMEPGQAKSYMANFYRERDNFIKSQAQQALRGVGVKAWREELRKNYRLSDDEMQELGNDPEMMEVHAKHIKRTRDQIEAVKKEHGITVAANRGQERLRSGAGVPLSGGGRNASATIDPEIKKGSRQHLVALIEAGVI